ncbi:TIGR00153 family protein [Alginatibacterium sediminis]|uniref:TIGR00153 family protein n=1 Tax=Alginatibacterium sediminis TaxID=2164068 RepID=A0A420ECR3_9ALTE|nr:TIGR00153 family protein [Alginatibacterium sediminis]RKF18444.1 TIGR00153 family protein [Alginatibacterium sediminis]
MSNTIMGLFAKSPIKPLEEHIDKVQKCCEALVPFFEAVFNSDWDEAAAQRVVISSLEKDADKMKRDIRLNLPSGIFMPVERTDLLELITHQDRIANKAKDLSGRVLGRRLEIPESIQPVFMAYVKRNLDATQMAREAINELEELLETGFRGREVFVVEKMINKLEAIEDDTDSQQIQLRRSLKALEDQLNPIDVMFLYHLLETVGTLADQAQRVGARLELMIFKA